MFQYRRHSPINAICAKIPTLVERRSPGIRISIGIIRIVRIRPPYEKKGDVSAGSESWFCVRRPHVLRKKKKAPEKATLDF